MSSIPGGPGSDRTRARAIADSSEDSGRPEQDAREQQGLAPTSVTSVLDRPMPAPITIPKGR